MVITKILIANRGEIVVRVIRACDEMGLTSVAVYSDADAAALHVRRADEAIRIGPAPSSASYLDQDAILRAAFDAHADAIHPGYGFLAENATFARRVVESGLTWIGPSPDVIAVMGDKVAAKEIARRIGVPVLAGYDGHDQSARAMEVAANRIGFPLLLKAAAGGGGKGMRVVSAETELADALESARREARLAFDNDRIFMERLIERPKHVEIQVLADHHGNIVSLGERDCSCQRRHQKVLEESPSPALSDRLRLAMSADARRLARAGGYLNAGTVEFLFEGDAYYFLEMNTRIQVEHPVTEMTTGLDLIRLQIEIACGKRLVMSQQDIEVRGHAIEARLYAEDPAHGFLPSTGVISDFRPPEGIGLRNDVGVECGAAVSPYYDPMLAKLIVHAETRSAAVARLSQALTEYVVSGVTTNRRFLLWLIDQDEFRAGKTTTGLIETNWNGIAHAPLPREVAIAAALYREVGPPPSGSPWAAEGSWRVAGSERDVAVLFGEVEIQLTLGRRGARTWRVTLHGIDSEIEITSFRAGRLQWRDGDSEVDCTVSARSREILVGWQGDSFSVRLPEPRQFDVAGGKQPGSGSLASPMPGTVVDVAVSVGDKVRALEPLATIETMKIEHVIIAPVAGTIRRILFHPGELVPAGTPVIELEPE